MSLSYVILGILSYEPMSGYALRSFMEKNTKSFWTAPLSQIYKELGTLERKEWVTSRMEHQEVRPDKKIYEITDIGRDELLNWLTDHPKSFEVPVRDEMSAKVFLGAKVNSDEMIFQLKLFIREKQKTLQELSDISESFHGFVGHKDNLHWGMALRKRLLVTASEIDWAKECITELQDL